MRIRKTLLRLIIAFLLVGTPAGLAAAQSGADERPKVAGEVIAVVAERPLPDYLPDRLAGVQATSEVTVFEANDLSRLVAGRVAAFREYLVKRAASRSYGAYRIDLFEAETAFAAFGLFSYGLTGNASRVGTVAGAVWNAGELSFRQGRYFVRVSQSSGRPGKEPAAPQLRLAREVSLMVPPASQTEALPPLLASLPAGYIPGSRRYFLGPEALGSQVERGGELLGFAGDAEAVTAEYAQTEGATGGRGDGGTGRRGDAENDRDASRSREAAPPLKLVIVEYHTPQFAFDSMARASEYLESLSDDERDRIIIKRRGNYIVEATNFGSREPAERLADSVEYPYVVKWLRDPQWPADDVFRQEKAAKMLLSIFGILGLMVLAVLVIGSALGTTIFFKRRKLQQEIFSDAGGMLRLGINQLEAKLIGLPPKRE
ncbi:MAG TPA: DUF6599 family protein [Blastocatellia bacterium]|nr:DUF6599 family protein [Blastocatellia bacterium]